MNPEVITIAIIGAAFGGGGLSQLTTWLLAKRTRSGHVETSEAAEVWTEGRKIREELRTELIDLRGSVDQLRAENTSLRIENGKLAHNVDLLRSEIQSLKSKLGEAVA